MGAMTVSMLSTPWLPASFGYRRTYGAATLLLLIGLDTALWILMVWTAIERLGLGFVLPSLNLGAMRSLELTLIAPGSSTINFLRQLGGAAGVNLIGIFLEWRLSAYGGDTPATGDAAAQLRAFHEAFAVLAVITAAAIIAARAMKPQPTGQPRPGLSSGDPPRATRKP